MIFLIVFLVSGLLFAYAVIVYVKNDAPLPHPAVGHDGIREYHEGEFVVKIRFQRSLFKEALVQKKSDSKSYWAEIETKKEAGLVVLHEFEKGEGIQIVNFRHKAPRFNTHYLIEQIKRYINSQEKEKSHENKHIALTVN